jgi:hypothetical protein
MTHKHGLIILITDHTETATKLLEQTKRGAEETPEGRMFAVIYTLPRNWKSNSNIEQTVSALVLKEPHDRREHDEWEFFGNLAVRSCTVSADTRLVESEYAVLMFRRRGDKAYTRRKSASAELLEEAHLPTLHPVFTRDIANNVWHFESADPIKAIIARLSILLTWPDEHTIIFQNNEKLQQSRPNPEFDKDLIGVPTKVDYLFASKNLVINFSPEV